MKDKTIFLPTLSVKGPLGFVKSSQENSIVLLDGFILFHLVQKIPAYIASKS